MIFPTRKWWCGAALGLVACWAHAQYPDRPITMIVPFPPGGVADTVARPVAEALSHQLGQSVVIENKAGAGGSVGIGQAARAAPDGYTVLMSLSSISILPEADRILGRKAAFQLDQFAPIARVTADPTVLIVRADSPWKTLQDFVAEAKRRPGALNYGSSGIYGSMHVPMEMLKGAAGIDLTHVPFTGAGPAVAALLGGQVDAISSGPSSVVQHIQAGKLRALAHWGDTQLAALPQVPTLASQGYDVKFVQWSGIFVPAGTPAPVVERLREASRKALNDPKVQQTILGAGSPVQYMDAPEFAAYWKTDAQAMARAVQRIGKVE
ncbi:tripartite tricarboxylate transporter substrate binding protein [Bordetella sp. BOR01]|uniref:Bug family tripartite tricarboxylate transporter substrate binding protein n=1 Tax=Bordetella sp. BOR01 TaxID=2854779 RepID=UPI001C4666D5|nr:tripartite tricarboxylate transporter substrate binding protein [Bordetella sp. BOR01]MBV7486264.1 tripartite tricarboxylate transporter substrate binding protein [Bordetella sp. BOR01]